MTSFFRRIHSLIAALDDDVVDLSLRAHVNLKSPLERERKYRSPSRADGITSSLLDNEDYDSYEFDEEGGSGVRIARKASVDDYLPHLTPEEKAFFRLVEAKNVAGVKAFLKDDEDINVNCLNTYGITPLALAVKNEDTDMIQCLLEYENVNIGDAFLHAVCTGNVDVVECVLKACTSSEDEGKKEVEFSVPENSSTFLPNTSPLMLAAISGHYDMIKYFLERGHTIEYPHTPMCPCDACEKGPRNEDLVNALSRVNTYRAITNPIYICQTSADPILTAFELCSELRYLAMIQTEFAREYEENATICSKFAVELLGKCQTSKEVQVLLHRKEGYSMSYKPYIHSDWKFARIGLAIHHEQKEFVAHSCVQHAMTAAWLDTLPYWERRSFFGKLVRVGTRAVLTPVMMSIHLILPFITNAMGFASPVQKYMTHTFSYIFFLILLILQTIFDNHKDQRGPPDTGIEFFIILYVMSFLLQNMNFVFRYGTTSYFKQKWNIYDMVMIILFLVSFGCWAWAWIDISTGGFMFTQRKYWDAYEPTLIGEAIYSVATMLAFGKVMFYFQIFSGVGPLQLSFSRMFRDIINFFLIFLSVMMAFGMGLYKLYHNYAGMQRKEEGDVIKQDDAFTTIENSMSTLYWALYGYGGPFYADLVVGEYLELQGNETVVRFNHHVFTERTGRTMYAIYHIAGLVILLNMLVAVMTSSLTAIQENVDTEWKFNRSRVWLKFVQTGNELPPPFSLIPTPHMVWSICEWLLLKLMGNDMAKCNKHMCCFVSRSMQTEEDIEREEQEHYGIMARLVQRYLLARQSSSKLVGTYTKPGKKQQRRPQPVQRIIQLPLSHSTPKQKESEDEIREKPSRNKKSTERQKSSASREKSAKRGKSSEREKSATREKSSEREESSNRKAKSEHHRSKTKSGTSRDAPEDEARTSAPTLFGFQLPGSQLPSTSQNEE